MRNKVTLIFKTFPCQDRNPYIRLLPKAVSSNIEKLDSIADAKNPINREEDLLRLEADLFEDAPGISKGIRPANWDLPQGPEPGPQWPRKKRPQIL
jgi:hypothetical protein